MKREPGYLYFVRGADILRVPFGEASPTVQVVWTGDFVQDPAYLYFLDDKGDVSRRLRPALF